MAKGLDELIDWLVAETAYCGEAGEFWCSPGDEYYKSILLTNRVPCG